MYSIIEPAPGGFKYEFWMISENPGFFVLSMGEKSVLWLV
jgi:hypothetical protein